MHFLILATCYAIFGFSVVLATPLDLLLPRSESSPNPIASIYPTNVTGTINSTISVIPIPYKLARSIIPPQYGILEEAYRSLLPNFPKDSYPLVIRAALDHGVGLFAIGFELPDFQSIHILYPFVDLLGDGYSSFTWNKYLLLSANNTLAQQGAEADGTIPVKTTFSPDLEAYAFISRDKSNQIYLYAYTNTSTKPSVTTKFTPLNKVGPYSVEFFKNVTNQPIFSRGDTCDNQRTLFNTTLTTGINVPVGIKGSVSILPPYFPAPGCVFDDNVYGIKVDVAFVENPSMNCSLLKGYSGTGSGD